MTNEINLASLLTFTRDGEWGHGEPTDGYSPALVIRGTDFENVRNGILSELPLRYIRSDILERKKIATGDTIIESAGGTKDQPTGRTVFIRNGLTDSTPHPLICASFSRFLRPNPQIVDPSFLFWKLQDEYHSRRMHPYHIQHTGVARFQYTQFAERHLFELPTLSQQRAIADTLSAIDDKIELNRRMNETLEASARALFRDWFVDFGPTRAKAEGRPAYLDADLWSMFPERLDDRGLPEGWNWESLLDQAHWVNGAAYKNMHFVDQRDGLPVVKIAELKAGVTGQTKFTNTDLGARYRIDDGELLFSWSGNPDTSIDAFLWAGGPAWLNQHIFAVRENGKRTRAELFVLLKWLMPEFAEIARNKQTTGLGHVTKDDMKRLQVVSPSPPLKAVFADCVAPIFDRILSNITESQTLADTRDMLLPKLMSGMIRVRDVASALATPC
jgi:type I restriction enzyme S subunit